MSSEPVESKVARSSVFAASHIVMKMTFFGFSSYAIAAVREGLEDKIKECTKHPQKACPPARDLEAGQE